LSWSQKTVTGTITDDKGTPVLGATVLVQDTNRGTTTDFDGKYAIEVSDSETLVFSSLGFSTKTILVGSQTTIDVILVEEASALSEVVVTGYSSQNTRDITGSVSVVKAEDLEATSPLNFEEALQGQSSGVVVGNQGGPGQGAVVRIRGYGTINGNDPLYIIDGTPTGAGLTDINPNDIESVQVLKDASSAAIYGNRAANGVIIVTTKSGKRNSKVNFSANAYAGVNFIPNSVFPDLASPQQLADAIWQASANDGAAPSNQQFGSGANPVLPVFLIPQGAQSPGENPYSFPGNRITRANLQGTDWFDEYFNSAIVKNFNVSASGGSENSRGFMSLSALDQEGVAYETDFLRYTLRANSSFDVTDRFRVGENVTISYSEQTVPPGVDVNDGTIASLYRISPLIPVRDVGGNFAGSGVGGLGNGNNPIAIADRNKDNKTLNFRAIGNFYGEFDVLKNFTFKSNLGFDLESVNTTNFTPASFEGEAAVENSVLNETSSFNRTYTWFNTLNYSNTFGEHEVDALVGTEFNKQTFRFFGAGRSEFLFDDVINIRFLDLGEGDFTGFGNGFIQSYFSSFGKVDYKFKDRYLLSATLRYDSSSVFTPENRDGFFPSFSAGWRVSNEPFLENSSIFNDLTVKLGYGVVANDGSIEATSIANTFSPNNDFFAFPNSNTSSATGYGLASRGNPDLQWETTSTINAGITARLINKIDFSFDFYDATTEDMLVFVPRDPTVLGQTNGTIENIGEMNNKGFDASIGYGTSNDSDFNFNIAFNISAYKNEVVFLDEENPDIFIQGDRVRDQIPNRTQAGEPLASFYGKEFIGIGPDGRMQFANDGETQFIGNPHPDFTYGLNFSGDYKTFDFSLLVQGSQGNDLYNFMKFFTDFNTFPGTKSIDYVTSNGLPALTNDAAIIANESAPSSYYVEDGSYVRLKNVVIGYSLPDVVSKKLGVEKIRWYIQGRNLITLTEYTGLDPEVNLRNVGGTNPNLTIGLDSGVYPIDRSVILGFNVSF